MLHFSPMLDPNRRFRGDGRSTPSKGKERVGFNMFAEVAGTHNGLTEVTGSDVDLKMMIKVNLSAMAS